MSRYYPIQTIDGAGYSGPPGLEMLLAMEAPPYGTEIDISVLDGSTGHFIYCYTALTTINVGGCVQLDYTGYTGTGGYYSPMITVPDDTGDVYHLTGVATKTLAAAGGLWVQTKGRCFFAKIGLTAPVVLGTHLKQVTAAQYFGTDHATVKTVEGSAIYEGCRFGAAGTVKWDSVVQGTEDYPFPSLVDQPIYKIAMGIDLAAQAYTTAAIGGDPACVVYLTGTPTCLT